jgi:hypothetical protein
MKFLLVRHEWWMAHKGWTYKTIEADSQRAADGEAALFEKEVSGQFNHVNCIAIKTE